MSSATLTELAKPASFFKEEWYSTRSGQGGQRLKIHLPKIDKLYKI